jgi:hypothetical protein
MNMTQFHTRFKLQASSQHFSTCSICVILPISFPLSKLYDDSELLGFWALSIVRYSIELENTTFRKVDLFPSSGVRVGRHLILCIGFHELG